MNNSREKSALFEEHKIPTEDSETLHVTMMSPKPPVEAKRIALIPPLVGAGTSQALIIFRKLTLRGTILVSFEYRGHPHSTGIFELDSTIVDTYHALRWAKQYARERSLPLHAFAMCYGVVPLLSQFRNGAGCPIKSLSAVSGLFSMNQIIHFEDFAPTFSKHVGFDLHDALHSADVGEKVNWNGNRFRMALQEYLRMLFPDLRVGMDFFEELQYDRVNMRNMLLQLINADYLDGVKIPPEIHCSVIYGGSDDLLGTNTPRGRRFYQSLALDMVPHADFHEMDVDHFGRGPERRSTIETVGDAFEKAERQQVRINKPKFISRGSGDELTREVLER